MVNLRYEVIFNEYILMDCLRMLVKVCGKLSLNWVLLVQKILKFTLFFHKEYFP